MITVWSYTFPVLVALVIALNRWTKWPHSWLIGALTQAGQIAIAFMYKEIVFGLWLSWMPMIMFFMAWVTAVKKRNEEQG